MLLNTVTVPPGGGGGATRMPVPKGGLLTPLSAAVKPLSAASAPPAAAAVNAKARNRFFMLSSIDP